MPMLMLLQLAGQRSVLADPDPLPSPPFFEHYLLEDPWPLGITLGVIGLCLAFYLSRRGRARTGSVAGVLCFFIGAAVFILARAVTTKREALAYYTDVLVRAGVKADAKTVGGMLRDDVTLTLLGRRTDKGKAYLVEKTQNDIVGAYNAKDTRIKWTTAAIDGPNTGRTQTRVIVNTPDYGPTHTTWMLNWVKDPDGQWRVRAVDAQQIGFMPQGSVPDP